MLEPYQTCSDSVKVLVKPLPVFSSSASLPVMNSIKIKPTCVVCLVSFGCQEDFEYGTFVMTIQHTYTDLYRHLLLAVIVVAIILRYDYDVAYFLQAKCGVTAR